MTKTQNSTKLFDLVWNGSLFDKQPSLISGYKTDDKGFNGRLINQGKEVLNEWVDDFTIYTQGITPVDYFLTGGFYDVVSDSVRRVIQETAKEEKVEFLPVKVVAISTGQEFQNYWAINVIEHVEALDWEKTIWTTPNIPYNDDRAHSRIIKPVMKLELIKDRNIFHLAVQGKVKSGIYLSSRLKKALESANCILGMEFTPVKLSQG